MEVQWTCFQAAPRKPGGAGVINVIFPAKFFFSVFKCVCPGEKNADH